MIYQMQLMKLFKKNNKKEKFVQKNNLKSYIKSKKCFKLILGANNENYSEIEKLVALYSAAGCRFFDINASMKSINAAQRGLKYSQKNKDCFLCVSVGADNDPHLAKCKINENICKICEKCISECLQSAIYKVNNKILINEKNCIGCSRCYDICPFNAIEKYQKIQDWQKNLPELMKLCDCIEFHIISDNIEEINEKWNYLLQNYNGILSICADRSIFSDNILINQLKNMISKNPDNIMIQADGAPMSGGKNDYKTTLQAVAAADIILKSGISVPVIISGGTNSKSAKLAKLCKVDISGVAIGSYARKIVKKYIEKEDFLYNKKYFNEALKIAKKLVNEI